MWKYWFHVCWVRPQKGVLASLGFSAMGEDAEALIVSGENVYIIYFLLRYNKYKVHSFYVFTYVITTQIKVWNISFPKKVPLCTFAILYSFLWK